MNRQVNRRSSRTAQHTMTRVKLSGPFPPNSVAETNNNEILYERKTRIMSLGTRKSVPRGESYKLWWHPMGHRSSPMFFFFFFFVTLKWEIYQTLCQSCRPFSRSISIKIDDVFFLLFCFLHLNEAGVVWEVSYVPALYPQLKSLTGLHMQEHTIRPTQCTWTRHSSSSLQGSHIEDYCPWQWFQGSTFVVRRLEPFRRKYLWNRLITVPKILIAAALPRRAPTDCQNDAYSRPADSYVFIKM